MEMIKKLLIVCLLLGISAAFVLFDQVVSTRPSEMNLERLPLSFGEWRGKSFPVDSRVKEILETDYILSRDYENGSGNRVFLSLVYYPDNKIGFHNPESCNTGVGMKVLDNRLVTVSLPGGRGSSKLVVNRLILGMSEPSKVIYYFYVTGAAMTGNYSAFRWEMMKQQLAFKRPSGAQVQIHVPVVKTVDSTLPLVEKFASALVPILRDCF